MNTRREENVINHDMEVPVLYSLIQEHVMNIRAETNGKRYGARQ